jgi:hypothetical protein
LRWSDRETSSVNVGAGVRCREAWYTSCLPLGHRFLAGLLFSCPDPANFKNSLTWQ